MSGVNIDFPLILTILVAGSGLIWLLDAMFLAPGRKKAMAGLQQEYPQWQEEGHPQEKQYQARVADTAAVPVVVEYAKSFFPVLLVVFVLRSFIVEPFQIPSSSMVPTLEVGDYILVNKFTYGLRLPVTRTKVVDIGEPKRGDVMVFFPPHMNETYFIKRVVGLPGDTVSYRDKRLFINGEPVSHEEVAVIPGPHARYRLGIEELGDARFTMQTSDARLPDQFSVVVKPGHYFMMGDNRDNSSDSRVWGQVPEKDIVGKAFAVWMHWEALLSVPSFRRAGFIE